MAIGDGTVGTNQRRAVIGRRISGGASSSPIVSPALGTTSEPARSATVIAESEPIKETPRADENMASTTDYSSVANDAHAEPRSDAIRDGLKEDYGSDGIRPASNQNSLNGSFSSGGLNSMSSGPSLNNPYPQQGGLPKPHEYQPPQGQPEYQQQSYQPPQGQPEYQQPEPPPSMPVSNTTQIDYGEPAAQSVTRTEREEQLPPPDPVPQVTKPVIQREEVVSNPNPTIGSYMASKDSGGGDDLYSLLNGIGKEKNLEKRKTIKELASGLLGSKRKKPKEV